MIARIPNLPVIQDDYLPFVGGLDLVTPVLSIPPGRLSDTQNYEIDINGGYIGTKGYERFDGQTAPSAANYAVLDVTISGSIEVDDTITGATSGATAVVVAVVTDDDQDYLVITKITGTFQDAEDLTVSSVVEANTDSTADLGAAATQKLHAQYLNLAADAYRSDIAAPTGSGSILGLFMLSDIWYALRNNAGGTAAILYKSTSSGWSAVALGRELAFTSGSEEPAEGDTIVGATSAATAVITRVVLESGSWSGGDAAGKFIFASQTGTFQAEDINISGGTANVATIAGDSSAITLSPDGRMETDRYNFGQGYRIYGADGVNRGFEFDGTVYVPIDTGMTTDTPKHVKAHKDQLFFSFGRSAQHSGIVTPYQWTVLTGTAELAVDDTITGFKVEPGVQGSGTMGIYSRNKIHMLYGSSSADWDLVEYREEVGAYPYSIQDVGMTMLLDDRGIMNLQTTQEYGNFSHSTLSRLIQPFLQARRSLVTASCVSRNKSQYRVFFSDGYGVYVTMDGRKILGMMPVLFDDDVTCVHSVEDANGNEVMMFGSSNGMVYQMEKGTSFDGAEIERFLIFHFYHGKSPRVLKGYKDMTLEVKGEGYAEFDFNYELGYADTEIVQPQAKTNTLDLSAGRWDEGTWDTGFWDARSLTPSSFKLRGSGENIAITIHSESDYFTPIRFSGALFHNLLRKKLRA